MKRGRYQLGAELRQQALDYIAAHPGATGPTILAALGWAASIGATRLSDMAVAGELRRSPTVHCAVNKNGHIQRQRTYAYWAIKDKTKSASETVSSIAKNLSKEKTKTEVKSSSPRWITKNTDPDRPPIKNQTGGQANVSFGRSWSSPLNRI